MAFSLTKICNRQLINSVLRSNQFDSHVLNRWSNTQTAVKDENRQDEADKLYRMIKLECRGNDQAVLGSYETFAVTAAKELGIQVEQIETPKPVFEKRILLRSAHVHKKHREHYEWRTYFKILTLKHLTGSTADTYLEYVQRNLPEGVAMIVHKHEIQKLPSHLKPPQ